MGSRMMTPGKSRVIGVQRCALDQYIAGPMFVRPLLRDWQIHTATWDIVVGAVDVRIAGRFHNCLGTWWSAWPAPGILLSQPCQPRRPTACLWC